MKKWLLVLLALAFAAPAGADVLIYKWNEKGVGFEKESGNWETWKENTKGYIVVEETGPDSINVWLVETWKAKDPNGKMQKYAEAIDVGTLELIKAPIGKKLMWIVTGETGDSSGRVLLMGQAKPTKIGAEKWTIAKKLDGYSIWDDQEYLPDRDISTVKISLRLYPKWTVEADAKALSGDAAADEILKYLESKKYIIVN